MQVPTEMLSKVQPTPIPGTLPQGCGGSAPFLVPSHTSKGNAALKGQIGGTVTAQLEGCPEGGTAKAALAPA